MTEQNKDDETFSDVFWDTVLSDREVNSLLEEVAENIHSKGSKSTKTKRQLLELRYHLHMSQGEEGLAGLTLDQIADLTGYTPARIGQIHKAAIQKYREHEYLQDDGELGGRWYFQEGN